MGQTIKSSMSTIEIVYRFEATHSVADDPELAEPHTRKWEWRVWLRGPLTGPGWVIRDTVARERMAEVIGWGDNLNVLLCDPNATSEKLVDVMVRNLRLPAGIEVVRSRLSEADSYDWAAHWP